MSASGAPARRRTTPRSPSSRSTAARSTAQIVDVGDEKQVDAAFAEAVKVMGHVDNCVANAGVSGRGKGSILEMDYEEWRRVTAGQSRRRFLHLPCSGQAHGRARQGRLAGGDGLAPRRSRARRARATTARARAASRAMVRALAVELARYRITVNSILPGWIETEMTANAFANPKFAGNVLPRIPQRRWGDGRRLRRHRRLSRLGRHRIHDGARLRHRWRLYVVLISRRYSRSAEDVEDRCRCPRDGPAAGQLRLGAGQAGQKAPAKPAAAAPAHASWRGPLCRLLLSQADFDRSLRIAPCRPSPASTGRSASSSSP